MKNLRKTNGFTLVEIVVASVLLAIIAAGVFSITLSSKKIISVSSQRYMATKVAETVLENLRQFLGDDYWSDATSPINGTDVWSPFYSLHDHSSSLAHNVSVLFQGSEFDNRYGGSWRYKVAEQPTQCSGSCDYRKGEVEVRWNETEL